MEQELFLIFITIIGSFVGTLTGFGTATIMIPAMLFLFPYTETLIFSGIIHWFSNLWRLLLFKKGFNMKIFLSFGVISFVTSIFGAYLTIYNTSPVLKQLLGIFLIGYGIFFYYSKDLKIKETILSLSLGGIISGLAAGIFGVGGAIRSAFLQAYKLPKEIYLANAALLGLAVDSTRIITYFMTGSSLNKGLWVILLICIIFSYFSSKFSANLVDKLPQDLFQKIVIGFVILSGISFLF